MYSDWPEVSNVASENRHELVLTGPVVSKRIKNAGLDCAVFSLTNLNFLNITDTCLESVPDEIDRLVNLQTLLLHSNKLISVTEAIGKLHKLKMLDLSRNQLTNIREACIEYLPQLTTLNLSCNKLVEFPTLPSGSKLTVVNLSNNCLGPAFPDMSAASTSLLELYLGFNRIKFIPENINVYVCLKCLDLVSNCLSIVPAEISDISKLKEINLKENPILDRRLLKLIDQCRTKQVLDYIRQHCPRKKGVSGKKNSREHGKKSYGDAEDIIDNPENDDRVTIHVAKDKDAVVPEVRLEDVVKTSRPFIVCCVLTDLCFDTNSFKKFIQMQTRLHDEPSLCDKRNAATIATHDLTSLGTGQLTYAARAPDKLMIKPLGRNMEVSGAQLYSQLQAEAEQLRKEKKRNVYSGVHRYLYLLEGKNLYSCLLDEQQRVVSLPPITNSDLTKMSIDSTAALLEVTSAMSLDRCRTVMDRLLLETATLGVTREPRRLRVHRVRITDMDGNMRSVYPSRADLVYTPDQPVHVLRE